MLKNYPYDDLVIYEVGAGNGTLANDILDLVQQEYPPEVYERIRYNIIEISPQLAKIQGKRLQSHPTVKVFNKSIFDWDTPDNSACFFIALEVIVCIRLICLIPPFNFIYRTTFLTMRSDTQ